MTKKDLGHKAFENMLDTILSRSYEWQEDFDEEKPDDLLFYGDDFSDLPLFDEEDILILMHRDVHFGGSFSAMREYYSRDDAKGIVDEIDPERINFLQTVQERLKHDLAPLLITGPNAEKIAAAKQMYKDLSEVSHNENSPEGALAAAILSEEPIERLLPKIQPFIAKKPESLRLLTVSDLFADPLFPGYGTAPLLAITLLGRLQYIPAIENLFYLIGRRNFAVESASLSALRSIGDRAKEFALAKLTSLPVTEDNERAALVALEFLPDPEIEAVFKTVLADSRFSSPNLKNYLLSGLEKKL